jgi:hypothetical protein
MPDNTLLEHAVTVRMTCARPEAGCRPGDPPPIVSFDDSPRALALAADRAALQEKARRLGLRSTFSAGPAASADALAAALLAELQAAKAPPSAVAVGGSGSSRSAGTGPRRPRCAPA